MIVTPQKMKRGIDVLRVPLVRCHWLCPVSQISWWCQSPEMRVSLSLETRDSGERECRSECHHAPPRSGLDPGSLLDWQRGIIFRGSQPVRPGSYYYQQMATRSYTRVSSGSLPCLLPTINSPGWWETNCPGTGPGSNKWSLHFSVTSWLSSDMIPPEVAFSSWLTAHDEPDIEVSGVHSLAQLRAHLTHRHGSGNYVSVSCSLLSSEIIKNLIFIREYPNKVKWLRL